MFILLYNPDTQLFGLLPHPLDSCSSGLRDFTSRAESTFPGSALPVQPIRIILQLKEPLGFAWELEPGSCLGQGWAEFPPNNLPWRLNAAQYHMEQ